MKKAELIKALEQGDDDATIEVHAEGECFEITSLEPDWTVNDCENPEQVPDPKRGLIEIRY